MWKSDLKTDSLLLTADCQLLEDLGHICWG